MAFTLPSDLATNWQDNVGMIENAAYLNAVGTMNNQIKAAITSTVNNVQSSVVATSESTTSLTYANLTTTTDYATVTVGASGMALVIIYATMTTANGAGINSLSYEISGNNTSAAADTKALMYCSQNNPGTSAFGATFFETGLATGSTTFKLKYKTNNASYAATFANRRIAVIPFF